MGVVYCIRCKITGETYYGSSILSIQRRMILHRSKRNKASSRSIIERGDYEVIVVEEVEDWLLPYYEKYYIKNFPCINQKLPFATKEENLQEDQKQSNRYHQTHQTEIRQRKARPYECECGLTIVWSCKARHLKTQRHLQGILLLGGISPPVREGAVV